MAIDDASLTNSPIYVLYIDFVNAFGSVDHARMASILKLQGFPADAIALVRDLYTNSNIIVSTPVGNTEPIDSAGRGTVQGDPLSPLLFILALDPLLRWLNEGDRAYHFSTSDEKLADLAYADDLAVIVRRFRDLVIQAAKVTEYCEWAGFRVNVDITRMNKTAWTGPISKNPSEQHVTIMGTEIPMLKPSETYIYLGMHVSLMLQWHKNSKSITTRVLAKLAAIRTMRQDPALILRTMETVVRPMIRYIMPMATLSWADVTRLNSAIWTTAKYIVGLSRHTSNMHIMRPRKELGMEIDPLHLNLADTLRQTIETLRNSQEDLGRMWAGLWKAHTTGMAAIGLAAHADSARTAYPTFNAMAQLADLDITWTNDDYTPPPTRPNSILTAVEKAFKDLRADKKRTPHLRALNPLWVGGGV